mmetsp:Transcript_25893/g.56419  ORF Transcript_25893/g.56419 Transcript_25893/m.56419 type:complete len:389 (-) Transcript_25893:900-2066(-)|eukprot:CAMPEP_0202895540 /NCGR_PEP_ID=MMETSP1392-20130828/4714_1 /ASSEMBLY_ACC=CAM_ASM_000868 /TAXON_ID=225041 /ORGANISM="Chlamydomonas chlamydogama, Strain SAG 11-48b" /LENGTH=388 /DNA_ID=CAMNT_0049580575 /DNA_START=119 /DNA_END=1285 /DNA_ORIENTATION=-
MLLQRTVHTGPQPKVQCRNRRLTTLVRAYRPPSNATSASELDVLQRVTQVVPDLVLGQNAAQRPTAAIVSAGVLNGIMDSETLGLKPYENAVIAAINYDRCRNLSGADRTTCQFEKALVNVGSLFAKEVEGRVSTEVNPALANDSAKMVAQVHHLLELYKENGVPSDKLIFQLPGTWAGIQAAKELEAKSVATQVYLIYSLVQGVAAAQAGASIVQPNVGRTRDWYNKNPGVIRDPKGPRQDAGYVSPVDPGVLLVIQLYNYVHKYHSKTKVMASGIRTKEDALALSGVDFLVAPAKVLKELGSTATTEGYNDGLHAAESAGSSSALNTKAAKESDVDKMGAITEASFQEGLGVAGKELLKISLQQKVADVQRLLPYFSKTTTISSNL